MISKNSYMIPVKKEDIKGIKTDSITHIGSLKNSIDYRLRIGTFIFAASSGEIILIKQNSKIGGLYKKYWNDGNRIVIKHKNKEYSAYEHLKYHGAKVKVGEKVKKGQLIGYSGNTGYSSKPHLHFQVFIIIGPNPNKDFKCLKIKFDENKE